MLALLAVAIITAYALYYFAPDPIRPSLGWLHAAIGCAWGGTIVWHRRNRRSRSIDADPG